MIGITIDPSKLVDIYFRAQRSGELFIRFRNNGVLYDVSDKVFAALFLSRPGGQTIFSLVPEHVSTGLIKLVFTEIVTNIPVREYYWQLNIPADNKTWLNGRAICHKGKFDGVDTLDDISINIGDNIVDVDISISGGEPIQSSYRNNVAYMSTATDGPLGDGNFDLSLNDGSIFVDGNYLQEGELVCFNNQYDAFNNGIYLTPAIGQAFERATGYDKSSDFKYGINIFVTGGNTNGGKVFSFTNNGTNITLGVNSISFIRVNLGLTAEELSSLKVIDLGTLPISFYTINFASYGDLSGKSIIYLKAALNGSSSSNQSFSFSNVSSIPEGCQVVFYFRYSGSGGTVNIEVNALAKTFYTIISQPIVIILQRVSIGSSAFLLDPKNKWTKFLTSNLVTSSVSAVLVENMKTKLYLGYTYRVKAYFVFTTAGSSTGARIRVPSPTSVAARLSGNLISGESFQYFDEQDASIAIVTTTARNAGRNNMIIVELVAKPSDDMDLIFEFSSEDGNQVTLLADLTMVEVERITGQ